MSASVQGETCVCCGEAYWIDLGERMACEACGFDTTYGHELEGCEVLRQEAEARGYTSQHSTVTLEPAADLCPQCDGETFEVVEDGVFRFLVCCDPVQCEEPDPKPAVRDGFEAIRDYCGPCLEGDGPCQGEGCGEWCTVQRWDRATRCRHGMDERQCVTCTGKRDEFGTVRKDITVRIAETGQFASVRPDYRDRVRIEIPATVRGSFGIGQVRAVITSGETETRQWTDAPSEGDWAGDENTPVYCQPKAKSGDKVPRWWLETERGVTPRKNVTPSWDEAIRQTVAAERAYLDSEALPDVAIVRGLVMTDSGRKRGDVDVQAWRASAKHRAEYVSTFNMDDHIPAR